MKIVRFSQNGHTPRLGCYVHQDEVMDLAASCVAFLTAHGVVRATAIADTPFPTAMGTMLAHVRGCVGPA